MEQVEFGQRLTKVETQVENIEKKVDMLDAKVEAGHTETEKQIGSLVICVKEFIATQTKTNEITEKLINEVKLSREKQEEKLDAKIDKMENKYDNEIKCLQATVYKNQLESVVENKDQDVNYQKDKVHISGKLIFMIIGAITFCIGTGLTIISLIKK